MRTRPPLRLLVAIILAVGPASGAHLNPVVTLVDRVQGGLDTPTATGYIGAQMGGGVLGAVVANLMCSEPAIELSTKESQFGGTGTARSTSSPRAGVPSGGSSSSTTR